MVAMVVEGDDGRRRKVRPMMILGRRVHDGILVLGLNKQRRGGVRSCHAWQ